MKNTKVLVGLTKAMLKDIDSYVEQGIYANRSDFIRDAIRAKLYTIKYNLHELER